MYPTVYLLYPSQRIMNDIYLGQMHIGAACNKLGSMVKLLPHPVNWQANLPEVGVNVACFLTPCVLRLCNVEQT